MVEAGSKPRTGVAESALTPYSEVGAGSGMHAIWGPSDLFLTKMTVGGVAERTDNRSERLTDGDEGN